MDKYDLVIKNGTIVDGTGRDMYKADLGISMGKIVKIGNLEDCEGAHTIDAEGKIVCPGFIDAHTHADLNMLIWPESEGYVMQGVTTTVTGNCGFSPAPVSDVWMFAGWEYKTDFNAHKDPYSEMTWFSDLDAMKKAMKEEYDLDIDYSDMNGFFEHAEKETFSVNFYPFVGHCNIRLKVMGTDHARQATSDEIEQMKEVLREEMKAGCRGISTGLDYPPGIYANTEELIELAKVAKEYGGSYITHIRSNPDIFSAHNWDILGGLKEAIRIGKEADIKVHIAHMWPAISLTKNSPLDEKIEAATLIKSLLDEAIAQGVQISYDVVPNDAGGGCYNPHFAYLLRPWILKAGSVGQFIKNLSDSEYTATVIDEIKAGKWMFASKGYAPNIEDDVLIIKSSVDRFVNKTLRSILEENNWGFEEGLLNLFKEDPYACMKQALMVHLPDEWLNEILDYPLATPSSDGFSYNHDSSLMFDVPLDKLPTTNNFCFAIRYLTLYGKQRLEDTIRQLTGRPAEIFEINDRGVLKEGNYADIVVFTQSDLKTNENFEDTRQFPDGIDYVIINGEITADHKKHTGAKAGRVLRA